jgi:hypothetical protein
MTKLAGLQIHSIATRRPQDHSISYNRQVDRRRSSKIHILPLIPFVHETLMNSAY